MNWNSSTHRTSSASSRFSLVVFAAAALLVAASCGGQKEGPSSADEVEKELEEELGYDIKQYDGTKFAPDEPRLRPGIQVVKMPPEFAAEVEIRAEQNVAVVEGAAAERLAQKEADAGDLLMGPNFNYQIKGIEDRGDSKRLEVGSYMPQDILWGHFDIKKRVRLDPDRLEEGGADGTPSLRIPPEELYGEDSNDPIELEPRPPHKVESPDSPTVGGAEPQGPVRSESQRLNTDANTISEQFIIEPPGSLGAALGSTDKFGPSVDVSGSISNTTEVTVDVGYDAEIVFEGRIHLNVPNISDFDWKEDYDSGWCDRYGMSADVWVASGALCVQKFGFRMGIAPELGLYQELEASLIFSHTWKPGILDPPPELIDIPIPIPSTPIAFKPTLIASGGIIFALSGTGRFGFDVTASLGEVVMGFVCDRKGGSGCTFYPQNPPQSEVTTDAFAELSAGARVEPFFGPGFRMDIGLTGVDWVEVQSPALNAYVYARLQYEIFSTGEREKCLQGDLGLKASFGGDISFNIDPPHVGPWDVPLTPEVTWYSPRLQVFPEVTLPGDDPKFYEFFCSSGDDDDDGGGDGGDGGWDDFTREPGTHRAQEPFKIEAIWTDTDSDIDLEVTPPGGPRLKPGDTSGGWSHPFDVCEEECSGNEHSEAAIYQPADDAPQGRYSFQVANNGGQTTEVTLNVRRGDRVIESWELSLFPGQSESFRGNYTPSDPQK